ncbi:MAG: hypothetical protein ACREGD_04415 [Candidatus Saccharimonadales bacterium]
MYDDPNANNQGDNTPPPMADTPIANDGPGALSDSTPADDTSSSGTGVDFTAPAATPQDNSGLGSIFDDAPAESRPSDKPQAAGIPADTTSEPSDLLDLKRQALEQLTPLVDHLDQTPKEEFRTTMMMIQATDNQGLVKKAFDAAQKIEDDKERAQAFLDIINEINYFTQQHQE